MTGNYSSYGDIPEFSILCQARYSLERIDVLPIWKILVSFESSGTKKLKCTETFKTHAAQKKRKSFVASCKYELLLLCLTFTCIFSFPVILCSQYEFYHFKKCYNNNNNNNVSRISLYELHANVMRRNCTSSDGFSCKVLEKKYELPRRRSSGENPERIDSVIRATTRKPWRRVGTVTLTTNVRPRVSSRLRCVTKPMNCRAREAAV